MATKYFMAGGSNSNYSDDTNWSTTASAGPNNTTKGTSSDDVILDAGSPACTVDSASACKTLVCTGYTNTLTLGANLTASGNVTLVSGMTFTPSTYALIFNATANFTSGTKQPFDVTASGATVTQLDALTITGTLTVTATSSSWNTGNFAFTFVNLDMSGTNTRSFVMGTGNTVTCSGNFNCGSGTGCTFTRNTGTIYMIGNGGTFTSNSTVTVYGFRTAISGITTNLVNTIFIGQEGTTTLVLGSGVTSGGTISGSGTSLAAPTAGYSTSTNFSFVTGTLSQNLTTSGTITFSSATTLTITVTGNISCGNLTVSNNTDNTVTTVDVNSNASIACANLVIGTSGASLRNAVLLCGGGTHTVTGNLSILTHTGSNHNTLNLETCTLRCAGNLSNLDAVTVGTSNFVMNKASGTQTITSGWSFYNFSALIAGVTLQFAASSTTTISGTLSLDGVILRSSTPTTAWVLAATGANSIYRTDAQDSDATTSNTINDFGGTNSLRNTNWVFLSAGGSGTGGQEDVVSMTGLPTDIGLAIF